MNFLIGLLSIVFFALSIAVIGKSMKLNKKLSGEDTDGYALDSANNVNAIGMLLFWLFGTIAGVWSFLHARPDFLPIAASEHGLKTDNMFWTSMAVVTFAFFISNTLLFFFRIYISSRQKQKSNVLPG